MVKLLKKVIHRKNPKRGSGSPMVLSYYGKLWDYEYPSETNREKAYRRANRVAMKNGKSMLIEQKGLKEHGFGNYIWFSIYSPSDEKPQKGKEYMKI